MNNQPENLLFFCSFPPPNTGQTIATKLIHDCLTSEYSIDIINIADKKRLSRKSGAFSFRIIWLMISKIIRLIFCVIKKKYRIVYLVYAPSKSALIRDFVAAWVVKNFSNAKIIAHLHNGNYGKNFQTGFTNFFFNKLMNYTDKLIFLSPMLNNLENITNNKVAYLPNMISETVVCTDDEIEKKISEKSKGSCFNIFFISYMIEEKGFMDLLKAAKLLTKRTNDFILHFAGTWPSEEKKRDFVVEVETCGLSKQTHIYGAIESRETIKQMFLEADIFVLPTYYELEAQPLSIIEALNSATPVISTYHAAIPDMVDDGKNGFLINPKSVADLADKLQQLMSRLLWMQQALNARNVYKSVYAKDVILPKLFQIFKQ